MTLIYNGPMTKTLTLLKRVSVTTLGLSITSSALMAIADSSPLIISTLGIAITTSILSTGLIHYCISPYVTDIHKTDGSLEIGTLSLSGNRLITKIKVSDLIPVHSKPFTNWGVNGASMTSHTWNLPVRKRSKFYIHPNLEDLKPEMKILIDKVSLSDGKNLFKNAPGEDWDIKVAELKKHD